MLRRDAYEGPLQGGPGQQDGHLHECDSDGSEQKDAHTGGGSRVPKRQVDPQDEQDEENEDSGGPEGAHEGRVAVCCEQRAEARTSSKPWTGYYVWKGYLEKDDLKDGCETADSRNCAVRDQRERLRVLALKCCSVMAALREAAGSCVATPLLRCSVGREDRYQFFKP